MSWNASVAWPNGARLASRLSSGPLRPRSGPAQPERHGAVPGLVEVVDEDDRNPDWRLGMTLSFQKSTVRPTGAKASRI